MAKEVGQKAVQKQFEIMKQQQNKAQEFIDQKVKSQLVNSFWLFIFSPFTFLQIKWHQIKTNLLTIQPISVNYWLHRLQYIICSF